MDAVVDFILFGSRISEDSDYNLEIKRCLLLGRKTMTNLYRILKNRDIILPTKVKPVNPKGNQPWTFIGRIDAEAKAPILWPPDAKSWFIRKDPDAGKVWRQEEKGEIEDKMAGWHNWLRGCEFEQTLGDSERLGSLACCSPWGRTELDATEWLTNKSE